MSRRFWKRNDKGELVEVFPSRKTSKSPYINMGSRWSRTTQIEFSEKSMDDYIKEMKK